MKKKSKIRVLKDNQNDNSYTFVMDLKQSIGRNLKAQQTSKETEESYTRATDEDNLNKIYKKKKVLTNEDLRKASKGLKFNNPSQRNHSSVYE
ncbi:hypothetical protein [Candidatus Nitrosocosmicus hydrocola]|jgi:hypothetical protein|uniref:hypothetical protein n=1 Tax=Candidatus Nitrosocosmicus hydrocola TaxID=1826872 RepID=UPI0011E590A6|nr:hypothetical protein [Candidatus Nitrosocosmicus hydrocola]